jgi:hypothetical protein
MVYPVDSTAYLTGTLAGMVFGLALAHQYIPWKVCGPWWRRTLRFLIGSAVLFGLNLGLQAIFPGEDGTAFHLALRFAASGVIGAWVTLGAPWLFRILRLVPKAERNNG